MQAGAGTTGSAVPQRRDRRRLVAACLAAAIAVPACLAGGRAAAQGEILLTLANPTLAAGPREIALTEADLLALPQVGIRTSNEFVTGRPLFEGPLARDVIALIGRGSATRALMIAANDFTVEIDLSEFDRYDVIFALRQDGRPLSRRDKGPIWVIYPMDDHPELQDPKFNNRLVWQLIRVELR